MKLYLVHCGYYDPQVSQGVYEFHTNFMVAAQDPMDAKNRAKQLSEFKERRMHVDGVQEIQVVDGYRIDLIQDSALEGRTIVTSYRHDQLATRPAPNA